MFDSARKKWLFAIFDLKKKKEEEIRLFSISKINRRHLLKGFLFQGRIKKFNGLNSRIQNYIRTSFKMKKLFS